MMSGVPLEELRPYLFLKRDRDATWHLLRVSSGLDSLVMGEGQILAQVKQVRIHPLGLYSFGTCTDPASSCHCVNCTGCTGISHQA